MNNTDFDTALQTFVDKVQALLDEAYVTFPRKVEYTEGKKYIRVSSDGSVFCFIDRSNGDVLKAAGWKTPAKNFSRGNIFDEDNGLGRANAYGVY